MSRLALSLARTSRVGWIMFIALVGAAVTAAQEPTLTADRVRDLAREITPHVSANEPGPLWAAFDDSMRMAMGDSTAFATLLSTIHDDVGSIDEIIDEDVQQTQGTWVYLAHCRFAKAPAPMQLVIAFTSDGRVAGLRVRPQPQAYPSTKLDYVQSTTLRLPFEGAWTVFWGGRQLEQNYHAISKTQRFAIDFLVLKNGESHTGEGGRLDTYFAYGRKILAPAAGRVVTVVDSLPDQEIGTSNPSTPYGNVVVIDHGSGEYSVLAHLQPRSVRVHPGDDVSAGDVIGLCGNSGNTSEPHLHFQLQNGPDLRDAEGLPARFSNLLVGGEAQTTFEVIKGQTVEPAE